MRSLVWMAVLSLACNVKAERGYYSKYSERGSVRSFYGDEFRWAPNPNPDRWPPDIRVPRPDADGWIANDQYEAIWRDRQRVITKKRKYLSP